MSELTNETDIILPFVWRRLDDGEIIKAGDRLHHFPGWSRHHFTGWGGDPVWSYVGEDLIGCKAGYPEFPMSHMFLRPEPASELDPEPAPDLAPCFDWTKISLENKAILTMSYSKGKFAASMNWRNHSTDVVRGDPSDTIPEALAALEEALHNYFLGAG